VPSGASSPEPSVDAGSGEPSDATSPSGPAAPELEARLPTSVGGVSLTVDSATGSTILAEDPGSRAIIAALRADGKDPDALSFANAYDETAASDLQLMAFSVDGMAVDKVLRFVIDSWLAASGTGVTKDQVTLDGREFTRINYGDQGALDYVLAEKSTVIVITTADPSLAAQAAAALP
jgi:hypothetical protein